MNVLHVNDHLAPKGGVETYLLSVIPGLEARGSGQGALFGEGDTELISYGRQLPLLSEPGWTPRRRVERAIDGVLDEYQPDVVHLHSIYNADAIEHLLDRVPVVVTSHDFRYLCPVSSFYFRKTQEICDRSCSPACFTVTAAKRCMTLKPRYSWKYYQRVRRVAERFGDFAQLIAPSAAAAERFTQRGFPPQRVTVLPYYCRIEPAAAPRPVPQRHQMLYLGRLNENKGWQYFIEALGRLPATVEGRIVGNMNSTTEGRLRSLAREHRCESRLHWSNWASAEQIRDYLRQASVLIFPSLWPETLGIVGLEAMAHGVPVVASDVGGVTEWLQHERTGLLVPPKDAQAIANAVSRIIEDPDLAHQMGVKGLQRVRERFMPEQHLDKLQQIYEAAAPSAATR